MNPKKETREAVSDAGRAADTNKVVILIFGTFGIRFVLEELKETN